MMIYKDAESVCGLKAIAQSAAVSEEMRVRNGMRKEEREASISMSHYDPQAFVGRPPPGKPFGLSVSRGFLASAHCFSLFPKSVRFILRFAEMPPTADILLTERGK